MIIFHAPQQRDHAPLRELNNGDWMPFAECPDRVDAMLASLDQTRMPADFGIEPILAVHDADYIEFLRSAHDEWLAAGREGDALGYTFPVVRRRKLALERIDARLGLYGFDAATPIASGTWEASYWSAQCALAGVDLLTSDKARQSFALSRPPGHHAGEDYCGGYCYLNAAAIAARAAQSAGLGRVAILDVDYHHGNGTQDIFYKDGDVFFTSIHADPSTDYPYYWGHSDERGEGNGAGTTLNLPLPRGTEWRGYQSALVASLEAIKSWGARCLIVSYGADTFIDDPISHFRLTTQDMHGIGAMIHRAGLPTLAIMEGGYAVESLGANVSAFARGLAGA